MKDQFKKVSFSQSGEDLIVDFLFRAIGMEKPSYIDIGAYHPYEFSNTALFYSNGSRGINIEPNPVNFQFFLTERSEDVDLNIGLGSEPKILDYFEMDALTLNTFSPQEADTLVREHGHEIIRVHKIKTDTLENIINTYSNGVFPDFMSLDVEGLDTLILNSINFSKSFPKVICVETISYSNRGKGSKNLELVDFLEKKGYMIYGDTYINTIFVKTDIWVK